MTASNFEHLLFSYLETLQSKLRIQPLVLGGVTASGGGYGAPAGGFQGHLPQTRVTFDLTEAESNLIPASGESLLDNLNRIRYRINALEVNASGIGTGKIEVWQDEALISDEITIVDFYGDLEVTVSGNHAKVYTHEHVFGEDITAQIDGVASGFLTENKFISNTLQLYYNGSRQRNISFSEYANRSGFSTAFVPASGSFMTVDYIMLKNEQSQWGGAWGQFNW